MKFRKFIEATKEGMAASELTRHVLSLYIVPILMLFICEIDVFLGLFVSFAAFGVVTLSNLLNALVGIQNLTIQEQEELIKKLEEKK